MKNIATECSWINLQFDPVINMHTKILMWFENETTTLDRYNSWSNFKLTTSQRPYKECVLSLAMNCALGARYT